MWGSNGRNEAVLKNVLRKWDITKTILKITVLTVGHINHRSILFGK